MLNNIYMRSLAQLIQSFKLGCHQYADNTQLFLLMDSHPSTLPECLASCLEAMVDWLKRSWLKLNPAKTEVLWLGRHAERQMRELPALDGTQLTPVPSVKSLGVILDSSLTMEAQVANVTRVAFFHLRQARLLVPYLSAPNLATVIHAMVTSRLDFCNSLYAGLPLNLLRKLQLVQNAAARVLTGTQWRAHITPVLSQLHWLQIGDQIRFKVLVLTFKALNRLGPVYLRDRLFRYSPQRVLRSVDQSLLRVPSPKEIKTGLNPGQGLLGLVECSAE